MRTVGFVSDFVASGYANTMVVGAGAAARQRDHLLVIADTGGSALAEGDIIDEMIARGVDGIVYATLAASRIERPTPLLGRSAVLLNCSAEGSPWVSIMPDDHQGGRAAVDVLALNSDESVVVVGDDAAPPVTAGRRRLAGIGQRLVELGLPPAHRVWCDWTVHDARRRLSDWLDAGADADAYICLNDRVAMGVYQALDERDIRIGVDVSVVSFDGSELADWLAPSVVSLAIEFARMGEMAVEALLDGRQGPAEILVPLAPTAGASLRHTSRA